jgi:hypothetical protein
MVTRFAAGRRTPPGANSGARCQVTCGLSMQQTCSCYIWAWEGILKSTGDQILFSQGTNL